MADKERLLSKLKVRERDKNKHRIVLKLTGKKTKVGPDRDTEQLAQLDKSNVRAAAWDGITDEELLTIPRKCLHFRITMR
jgi:hypothetical protein